MMIVYSNVLLYNDHKMLLHNIVSHTINKESTLKNIGDNNVGAHYLSTHTIKQHKFKKKNNDIPFKTSYSFSTSNHSLFNPASCDLSKETKIVYIFSAIWLH